MAPIIKPIESKPDGSLYRMTPGQFERTKELIRQCCSRYTSTGGCSAGDSCECIQSISLSVCCKCFRWEVLPLDKKLLSELFPDAEKDTQEVSPMGKKLSRPQYKSVSALIHNICSNYDRSTGGCLLLDCGEVVKCPQLRSDNLVCRFFYDVLLEDPEVLALKSQIKDSDNVKECERCHKLFRPSSNRAKYCTRCAKIAARERKAEWKRENSGRGRRLEEF